MGEDTNSHYIVLTLSSPAGVAEGVETCYEKNDIKHYFHNWITMTSYICGCHTVIILLTRVVMTTTAWSKLTVVMD